MLSSHFARFIAANPGLFGTVLPAAQGHVARLAGLSDPRQVAFAPDVHARDIYIDRRGRRERFGFGVYYDGSRVDALPASVGRALR